MKVLYLVDGNKPTMGYLYEAMDRAKEAIHSYYEEKGDDRYERHIVMIGHLIDEQGNKL